MFTLQKNIPLFQPAADAAIPASSITFTHREATALRDLLRDAVRFGVELQFRNDRGDDVSYVLDDHGFDAMLGALDDTHRALTANISRSEFGPITLAKPSSYLVILESLAASMFNAARSIDICIARFDRESEAQALSDSMNSLGAVTTTVVPDTEVVGA